MSLQIVKVCNFANYVSTVVAMIMILYCRSSLTICGSDRPIFLLSLHGSLLFYSFLLFLLPLLSYSLFFPAIVTATDPVFSLLLLVLPVLFLYSVQLLLPVYGTCIISIMSLFLYYLQIMILSLLFSVTFPVLSPAFVTATVPVFFPPIVTVTALLFFPAIFAVTVFVFLSSYCHCH